MVNSKIQKQPKKNKDKNALLENVTRIFSKRKVQEYYTQIYI